MGDCTAMISAIRLIQFPLLWNIEILLGICACICNLHAVYFRSCIGQSEIHIIFTARRRHNMPFPAIIGICGNAYFFLGTSGYYSAERIIFISHPADEQVISVQFMVCAQVARIIEIFVFRGGIAAYLRFRRHSAEAIICIEQCCGFVCLGAHGACGCVGI